MNLTAQQRALWIVLLFAGGFTLISGRLIQLQLVNHEAYREKADEMHTLEVPLPPKRGSILDARGRILAQTVTVTDLRLDGKIAAEKPEKVAEVAATLGWSEDQLRAYIRTGPGSRHQLVAEELPESAVAALRSLRSGFLIFAERSVRVYPNGHEGSHILGFSNIVREQLPSHESPFDIEVGQDGMERVMDAYLRGTPGSRRIVRDARQHEIAGFRKSDRPPRDGLNVVLTIDQGVQHILETEADRIVAEFRPASVHIVAVRPATGEIIGLTNRPTYDPNDRKTMTPENVRNAAIMNLYEPGSTFKTFTLAAILAERLAGLDTEVYCENGIFHYAGHPLKDVHPYGRLTVREAYAKSSNIAIAKLALMLGEDRLYRYLRQFGFGQVVQPSGQALHGEERGVLRPPGLWTKVSLTRVPIGYEIAVTNLQMAMAAAAIANDGKLMEPRFVQAVVDDQKRIVKQFLPKVVRQAVPREVAAQVREAMAAVVETGTGRAAALSVTAAKPSSLDGFTVAGKTGTARKFAGGSYEAGSYYSSFIGFVPADNPEFLVSVLVDDPEDKESYGGKVAAPAFRNIAVGLVQALNLSPRPAPAVMATRRSG